MQGEKTSVLRHFFKGLKTEFHRIVFPTREDVVKESIATVIVSVFIGAIIFAMDFVINYGLGLLMRLK